MTKTIALLFACICLCATTVAAPDSATTAPIIGINLDVGGDSTGSVRLALSGDYVDAITSAGGIPILLPPVYDPAAIERQVNLCQGFVFTGGRDINPARFGQPLDPTTKLLNPRREEYDFALIDAVLKSGKPFLGICLGAQEINVALGGSLIQDIPSATSTTVVHRQDEIRENPAHEIQITTGTRLADVLGTTTLAVNSFHHQACDRPGAGVKIVARAPDGIVEGYEVENKAFGMGLQWHPEGMFTSATVHLKPYKALVDEAGRSGGDH